MAVLSDTDVDAPDLHLLLKPWVLESRPFTGGKLYRIDEDVRTGLRIWPRHRRDLERSSKGKLSSGSL